MIIWGIIVGIITSICLFVYLIIKQRKSIRIEKKVEKGTIIYVTISGFLLVTAAFWVEVFFDMFFSRYSGSSKQCVVWLYRLIDNGFFIPIILVLISCMFGKFAVSNDMDLDIKYDKNTFKVIFTISILLNIFYVSIGIKGMDNQDISINNMINRCIIWLAAVVSVWLEFGIKCDGRIHEKEIKKRAYFGKENMVYWGYISLPILGLALLSYFMTMYKLFEKQFYSFCGSMICTLVILLNFYLKIFRPNEKKSVKRFKKAYKAAMLGKSLTGYFMRIKYRISKDELFVFGREVDYKQCPDKEELNKLFNERIIEINNENKENDEQRLIDMLKQISDSRSDYISKQNERLVGEILCKR